MSQHDAIAELRELLTAAWQMHAWQGELLGRAARLVKAKPPGKTQKFSRHPATTRKRPNSRL
jgi:hypothetical protein